MNYENYPERETEQQNKMIPALMLLNLISNNISLEDEQQLIIQARKILQELFSDYDIEEFRKHCWFEYMIKDRKELWSSIYKEL